MPNFNVDWSNFVFYNLPEFKRKLFRFKWLVLAVSEVKNLHTKFLSYRTNIIYKVSHTNQKISIEKVLNDAFDPINQEIYIDLLQPIDVLFLRNKAEVQPIYLYNKWSAATAYLTGEFASHDLYVWKALQPSTNETPFDGSTYWEIHKTRLYLYNKPEYVGKGFIVFVPVALVYDVDYMKSLIDFYRLAGMNYVIQTYIP